MSSNDSLMLYVVATNKCYSLDIECNRSYNTTKCKVLEGFCISCPIDSYKQYCEFYGLRSAYFVYALKGINKK